MRRMAKKEEQHTLASQYLHEIEEWVPPRFRRRKPPKQLEGQIDLVELVAAGNESSCASDNSAEREAS